ncbi:hypothetical protein HY025_01080 [Candidatus Daviesbacteria bacterium]|nr:hypothetical protein [Candidatus Daviesbacteria bacterium]
MTEIPSVVFFATLRDRGALTGLKLQQFLGNEHLITDESGDPEQILARIEAERQSARLAGVVVDQPLNQARLLLAKIREKDGKLSVLVMEGSDFGQVKPDDWREWGASQVIPRPLTTASLVTTGHALRRLLAPQAA